MSLSPNNPSNSTPPVLWLHVLQHLGVTLPLLAGSLLAGIAGYHFIERMSWIDAFFNAAMIMGGMGPADEMHSNAGKIFAGIYALYSGLFLIAVTGYMLIPFLHRVMHKFYHIPPGEL